MLRFICSVDVFRDRPVPRLAPPVYSTPLLLHYNSDLPTSGYVTVLHVLMCRDRITSTPAACGGGSSEGPAREGFSDLRWPQDPKHDEFPRPRVSRGMYDEKWCGIERKKQRGKDENKEVPHSSSGAGVEERLLGVSICLTP